MAKNQPTVWFVNRFFYPDESATSQILSDVAFDLSHNHFKVGIITSRLNYAGATRYPKRDTINGVEVIRISTTSFGRGNILGRLFDYLSFYVAAFFSVLINLRAGDVCVIKTDPPLISIPLSLAARIKGAHVVNWLQDIFPDVAEKLGMSLFSGFIGNALKALRDRSWKRARLNIAIGSRMKAVLEDGGVPEDKIAIIQNFTDDETILPVPFAASKLREQWGFKPDDFIVAYSGNLGRAHDYKTILQAAKALSHLPDIKFLFIGGGKLRELLEKELEARPIPTVSFQPYQPRDMLNESLGAADLHWVSLQPELEGFIVPSKIYGIAAAGRGALFLGDKDGEVARMLEQKSWGVTVSPGDVAGCVEALTRLYRDQEAVRDMGRHARRFLEENATKAAALGAWRTQLKPIIENPNAAAEPKR